MEHPQLGLRSAEEIIASDIHSNVELTISKDLTEDNDALSNFSAREEEEQTDEDDENGKEKNKEKKEEEKKEKTTKKTKKGGHHEEGDEEEDHEEVVETNGPKAINEGPKDAPQSKQEKTAKLSTIPEVSIIDTATAHVESKLGQDFDRQGPYSRVFDYLLDTIKKLEEEKKTLERPAVSAPTAVDQANTKDDTESVANDPPEDEDAPIDPKSVIYETFHLVYCGSDDRQLFRDVPRKFKGDLRSDHLRGRLEVENLTKYFKKHKHVSFAHCFGYSCVDYRSGFIHSEVGLKGNRLIKDASPAKSYTETISLSDETHAALRTIMEAHKDVFKGYSFSKDTRGYFYQPYLPFYAHNRDFQKLSTSSGLDDVDMQRVQVLCDWFEEHYREEWDEADELFSRGKVTQKHYSKLIQPNELVVGTTAEGNIYAQKTNKYPWSDSKDKKADAFFWKFNGSFQKSKFIFYLDYKLETKDEEVDITSLKYYPLRFAKDDLRAKLIARGEKFWSCRKKKIICFKDPEDASLVEGERRYMVDYKIMKRMHSKNSIFEDTGDDLGKDAMDAEKPPDEEFLALLPPTIHAFDLQTKSWTILPVENITDVTWNKSAFSRLVVPDETKELIQALVQAQTSKVRTKIQTQTAPDVIAGKGNGLLILLHGPPGTGKTLTAESIAELEEKPLYRVTCGDIGLEPPKVERYLETVLNIGKAWDCVVLLDEADVFIEERNHGDMQRNALISVFLRVLEYYSGILILTTNRVGVFDGAFKSRIQLALRYPSLDQQQRKLIWKNFFDMLGRSEERIDLHDLNVHVDDLAKYKMNGRQIRNAVATARHLALFRKEKLVYHHLWRAIETIIKFDDYLEEVNGVDDELWARDQQIR